jgi:hypothetical protein
MIQLLDILKIPWTLIVLDFVVKLLLLRDLITGVKYDSILVIINRLTKYIYIILYLEANIAEDLVYAFLRVIIANYNTLKNIFLDKNKFFIL